MLYNEDELVTAPKVPCYQSVRLNICCYPFDPLYSRYWYLAYPENNDLASYFSGFIEVVEVEEETDEPLK